MTHWYISVRFCILSLCWWIFWKAFDRAIDDGKWLSGCGEGGGGLYDMLDISRWVSLFYDLNLCWKGFPIAFDRAIYSTKSVVVAEKLGYSTWHLIVQNTGWGFQPDRLAYGNLDTLDMDILDTWYYFALNHDSHNSRKHRDVVDNCVWIVN